MRLGPSTRIVLPANQASVDVDIRQTNGAQLLEIEVENPAVDRIEVEITVSLHGFGLPFRSRDGRRILVDIRFVLITPLSFIQRLSFLVCRSKNILSIAIMLFEVLAAGAFRRHSSVAGIVFREFVLHAWSFGGRRANRLAFF